MMKKLLPVLLLMLLAGLFIGSMEIKQVEAIPIEVTRTFSSLTYDGRLVYKVAPTYGEARNSTTATDKYDEGNYLGIGQRKLMDHYYIERSFVYFSTNIIPDDANITSATLSLCIEEDGSTKDFNVTIQNGQPTYPHIPLQKQDYYYTFYSGNGGSKNISTLPELDTYWNITLNSNGIQWINEEGITKLCLRSSDDIGNVPPTGIEWDYFYAAEKGEAYAPILYVTYETEGYNYIVHGPYFEDGSVADKFVNLTLQIENMPNQKYNLNGTDGVADSLNISVEQRGIAFTWNFTAYQNYTRVFCLTSDAFEEIWIFIPEGNVYLYTFEINNFAGVSNAYMETIINVGGQNRIVERQSLEVIYLVPFYMIFGDHYTLRLASDEGTFTWGDFIPLSTTTVSLTVRGVDFPKATLYKFKYVRIYAFRKYGNVTVVYEDLLNMTNSVTIYINYLNGSNAYNATETADAFVHQWLNGDNSTDYYTDITIDHDRYGTYGWKQFLTRSRTVNPFDFTWLGTASFDTSPLISILIVVLTACAFSVLNPQIGAFAACVVATFLTLMGWLPIPTPLLIGAWCFTFLFALAMSKVRVRT